jgi:seryl-tRNA synthetase
MANISLIATILGIIGGGGLVGLLGKVIKMSMDYQKLKSDLQQTQSLISQNSKRDEEERKENALKFNELYNSRNKTNEALVELTTTVKMMVTNIDQQFCSLNKKIDELKAI